MRVSREAFFTHGLRLQLSFNDSGGKSFVSKADYVTRGPRTVLGQSPSLL